MNNFIYGTLVTISYYILLVVLSIGFGFLYLDTENPYRQSGHLIDSVAYLIIFTIGFFANRRKLTFSIRVGALIYAIILGVCLRLLITIVDLGILNNSYNENSFSFLFLVNIIIIVPITEELFFRGIILKRFVNQDGWNWQGVIFSSILFAAIHYHSGLYPVIFAFGSGIMFGYFYLKFGLTAVIIAHVFDNLVWYLLKFIV